MHPCCTSVSRMILKRNRNYSHNLTNLGLDRNILHPSTKRNNSRVSPLYTQSQFTDCQRKLCISSIKVSFFQLATEGIESAVYIKLIAPFKDDLPASHIDGFRRVCADHNYAYFGPNIMNRIYSLSLSCQLVPLPGTSHRDPWAFIISKNSSYKGLINWRWDNKIR
jgi:hypothetical protein